MHGTLEKQPGVLVKQVWGEVIREKVRDTMNGSRRSY